MKKYFYPIVDGLDGLSEKEKDNIKHSYETPVFHDYFKVIDPDNWSKGQNKYYSDDLQINGIWQRLRMINDTGMLIWNFDIWCQNNNDKSIYTILDENITKENEIIDSRRVDGELFKRINFQIESYKAEP